jgi:DivIVA domain-containing protein
VTGDPDGIAHRSFSTSRRGYDPNEVGEFLRLIAREVRGLRNDVAELREREADLQAALDDAEYRVVQAGRLDAERPGPSMGPESARVIDAARTAALEIQGRAKLEANQMVDAARREARSIRGEAELALHHKTREADDAVAERLLQAADAVQQADADAAARLTAGRQSAAREIGVAEERARVLIAEASEVYERARDELDRQADLGRERSAELIADATALSEGLLSDLVKRRTRLRQQVEQLQAGRDRLLTAYVVVRESLDAATFELGKVLPEAKQAADAAVARLADDDIDVALHQALARLRGSPLLSPAGAERAASVDEDIRVDEPAGASEPSVELAPPTEPEVPVPVAAEVDTSDAPAAADVVDITEVGADVSEAVATDQPAPRSPPADGRGNKTPRAAKRPASKTKPKAPTRHRETAPAAASMADAFAQLRAAATPVGVVDVLDSSTGAGRQDRSDQGDGLASASTGPVAPGPAEPSPSERSPAGASDSDADLSATLPARRDAALATVAPAMRRRLKGVLADDENELLDRVRRLPLGLPTVDDALIPEPAHLARYEEAVAADLGAAVSAGAELGQRLADEFVQTTTGPGAEIPGTEDLCATLAVELVGDLRELLLACFEIAPTQVVAAGSGGGPRPGSSSRGPIEVHPDHVARDELLDRLRLCYREVKAASLEPLADGAAVLAVNRGLRPYIAGVAWPTGSDPDELFPIDTDPVDW